MALVRYLSTLKAHLPGGGLGDPDLLDEVRGHLEECARDLQLGGLPIVESEEEAVRRFGLPDEVAAAWEAGTPGIGRAGASDARPRCGSRRLVAAGLVALALAGTLGGGMAAASLSRPAPPPRQPHSLAPLAPTAIRIAPR